jgi:hypothetical protein
MDSKEPKGACPWDWPCDFRETPLARQLGRFRDFLAFPAITTGRFTMSENQATPGGCLPIIIGIVLSVVIYHFCRVLGVGRIVGFGLAILLGCGIVGLFLNTNKYK